MQENKNSVMEGQEIVSRFEKFDFESLWKGRDKVDLLEKSILSDMINFVDKRRVLELGTGNGRLGEIVQRNSKEYVAADINKTFLKKSMKSAVRKDGKYVASNMYHLPFANGSFSSVVMIRVFNFASLPDRVLKEISRVLVPGGFLIISINPKPSLSTFVDDLKYHFHETPSNRGKSTTITFSREDISEVHPASSPTYAMRRGFIRNLFRINKLAELKRVSSGLEDFFLLRRLPTRFFIKLGAVFQDFFVFPNTFYLLQTSEGNGSTIAGINEILACPECGLAFPKGFDLNGVSCASCGFKATVDDGIVDLTYIPDDAKLSDEGD